MPTEPTRWVIVDDTSADIEYIGSWSQDNSGSQDHIGNFGPTFNATSHYTTTSAILRYKFKGTRIYVVGTNNVRNDSGAINPSWECDVDAKSITANVPASGWWVDHWVNNYRLCESDDLEDQEHILTLYTKSPAVRPQALWFDRISYAPSASVPLDNETIYVESSDPALKFSNGWGIQNLISNITRINGTQVTFEFYGTSLSWYGTLWNDQPTRAARASYSIDGQGPTTFELTGLPPNTNITRYNEEFFKTPTYSAGRHTLNVQYQGNAQSVPLVLDYLIIQNGTAPVATVTPIVPSSESSTNHTGAIVGGVAGAVVFIFLVILVFVTFLRKRNKRLKVVQSQSDYHLDPTYVSTPADISSPQMAITPFPSESTVFLDTRAIAEQRTVPSKLAAFRPAPMTVDGQQSSDPATLIGRGQISGTVLNNLSPSASRSVLSATDSGRRLHVDNAVEVGLLPPQYTYD